MQFLNVVKKLLYNKKVVDDAGQYEYIKCDIMSGEYNGSKYDQITDGQLYLKVTCSLCKQNVGKCLLQMGCQIEEIVNKELDGPVIVIDMRNLIEVKASNT